MNQVEHQKLMSFWCSTRPSANGNLPEHYRVVFATGDLLWNTNYMMTSPERSPNDNNILSISQLLCLLKAELNIKNLRLKFRIFNCKNWKKKSVTTVAENHNSSVCIHCW